MVKFIKYLESHFAKMTVEPGIHAGYAGPGMFRLKKRGGAAHIAYQVLDDRSTVTIEGPDEATVQSTSRKHDRGILLRLFLNGCVPATSADAHRALKTIAKGSVAPRPRKA